MSDQPLKLRKIGNSVGFILPKELQNHLNIAEGDELYATVTDDGLTLSPYDPLFQEALSIHRKFNRRYRNAMKELAK